MRQYSWCTYTPCKRLDQYLAQVFPQHSRSFFQDLIKKDLVTINNVVGRPDSVIRTQDEIEINFPDLKSIGLQPTNIPLEILYEDTDILVINKPAGMVVHPSDNGGHLTDTLVNAVLYHCGKDLSIKSELRPGIVHRLDKDTSGIIAVAKNDEALEYLAKQWENRTVQKEYTALVCGVITENKGTIEAPIGRSQQDRKKMSIRSESGGKNATTEFEVLKRFKDTTLLKVKILTGRTHQIRVHFASIGHPIIGDQTYGNRKINELYDLERQFLHASKLTFKLPSTKKEVTFEAPLPEDLEGVLRVFK